MIDERFVPYIALGLAPILAVIALAMAAIARRQGRGGSLRAWSVIAVASVATTIWGLFGIQMP